MDKISLNYEYYHVKSFIESLEKIVKENKGYDCDKPFVRFTKKTIKKLKKIITLCKITSFLMQDVQKLYDGDIGEKDLAESVELACKSGLREFFKEK
jgi:hypothetical protein